MVSYGILFIKMIDTFHWWSWCFTTWWSSFSALIKFLPLITTFNIWVEFSFIRLLRRSLSLFILLFFVLLSRYIIVIVRFMVGFKVRSLLHALADLIIAWGNATFTCGLSDLFIYRLRFFIDGAGCLMALFLLLSVFIVCCYYSRRDWFLNRLFFLLFIFF